MHVGEVTVPPVHTSLYPCLTNAQGLFSAVFSQDNDIDPVRTARALFGAESYQSMLPESQSEGSIVPRINYPDSNL